MDALRSLLWLHYSEAKFRVEGLGSRVYSYVVPFWLVYQNPLPKNHNKLKKELHKSPWVGNPSP